MNNTQPKYYKIEQPIFFLMIVSGLWGPNLVNVTIGSLYIYPFRVLFPFLVLIFFLRNFKQRMNLPHIQVRGTMMFLFFWIMYGGISLLWADFKDLGLLHWSILIQNIVLIFFVVNYVTTAKALKKLVLLSVFVLGLTLLVGLWETWTGSHLELSSYYVPLYEIYRYVPTGTFYNPNDFATYITIFLPILLIWTVSNKSRSLKLLGFIMIISSIYILIKTESRANYIAVAIEFFLWFIITGKIKDRLIALIALGVIGIIISIGLLNLDQPLLRFLQLQLFSLSSETLPDSIRLQLLQAGFKSFLNSWGMGLGPGNVNALMPAYMSSSVETMNVHNFWLEILFNYGVLIFLSFIIVYAQILKQLFIIRFTQKYEYNQYAGGLFLSMIGIIIGGTSSSSLIGVIPFWVLLGLCIAVINIYRLDTLISSEPRSADFSRKSQKFFTQSKMQTESDLLR